jgi:hypothetical protein
MTEEPRTEGEEGGRMDTDSADTRERGEKSERTEKRKKRKDLLFFFSF